jgi:hypothetical protein
LIAYDGKSCTVDVNGKPIEVRVVVVKLYYRNESTIIPNPETDQEHIPEVDDDEDWLPPYEKER